MACTTCYSRGTRQARAVMLASPYSQGSRTRGILREVSDLNQYATPGQYYEDFHVPGRPLNSQEIHQSVDQVFVQKWFVGAQVNWVYADANQFRCQWSYPKTEGTHSMVAVATIIAIVTAIGVILTAVAQILWASTAFTVVTAIPPEAWKYIVYGSIIIGGAVAFAYVIRSLR